MNESLRKGNRVRWNTSGQHASEVSKAKSIHGDGPFIIHTVVNGVDFDPNYGGPYVILTDMSDQLIKRGNTGALFEAYLFQRD